MPNRIQFHFQTLVHAPPAPTTKMPHKFGGTDIKMIRTKCKTRVCEAMCHLSHFDGGTCFGNNYCHCYIHSHQSIHHGEGQLEVATAIKKKGQKPHYMKALNKDLQKLKVLKGSLRLRYRPGTTCKHGQCERKCWILDYEKGECAGKTDCYCFHDHLHSDNRKINKLRSYA
ncbi:hypothetical protein JYU34_017540 [Plutella xylostella]|uniref:Uncharacterized protein n=1 Tax=Plutella xylostella TaxID=51655 RepID=A0ABQ7Q1N5_PLUXY|nr:hypothetical protein JYU34_017540 [Plutella xylostella]